MVDIAKRVGSGRYMGSLSANDEFCHHVVLCLFCRMGDTLELHFCKKGHELLIDLVDEWADKVEWVR